MESINQFLSLGYLEHTCKMEVRPHFAGDNLFMIVSNESIAMCARDLSSHDLVVKDRQLQLVRFCIRGAEVDDGRIDVYASVNCSIGSIVNDIAHYSSTNFVTLRPICQFRDVCGGGFEYKALNGPTEFATIAIADNSCMNISFTHETWPHLQLKALIMSYGIQLALTKHYRALCNKVIKPQCYRLFNNPEDYGSGKAILKAERLHFSRSATLTLRAYTKTMDDSNMTYILLNQGDNNKIMCSFSYTLHSGQMEVIDTSGALQYYTTKGPAGSRSTHFYSASSLDIVGWIERSPCHGATAMAIRTHCREFICPDTRINKLRILTTRDGYEDICTAMGNNGQVNVNISLQGSDDEYVLLLTFVTYVMHQMEGDVNVPALALPTIYITDHPEAVLTEPRSETLATIGSVSSSLNLGGSVLVIRAAGENSTLGIRCYDIVDKRFKMICLTAECRNIAGTNAGKQIVMKDVDGAAVYIIHQTPCDSPISVVLAESGATVAKMCNERFVRPNGQVLITPHRTRRAYNQDVKDYVDLVNAMNIKVGEIVRSNTVDVGGADAAIQVSFGDRCSVEEAMLTLTVALREYFSISKLSRNIPQIDNYYGRAFTH